jgi:alanyl-tRNA synthetase
MAAVAAFTGLDYSASVTPTERLYFSDPWLSEFEADVVAHAAYAEWPTLVLDRSAFYPEGGGQLSDRGTLGGLAVVDVQVDDAGIVHHVVDGALPPIGTRVRGEVERARRRSHMALHTGQHILSRALADVAKAETVSARLGETQCTIDLDLAALDDALLARAEELANAVVDDDLEVRAFFPTPDELAALPLRREPKVSDEVRIVAVGDFDFTPCGGTHCTRSAEVGTLHVTGTERYKGGTRVLFVSGPRARRLLVGESDTLREMARGLSCGPFDVPTALAKLERELAAAREELGITRARLAQQAAVELCGIARERGRVVAVIEGATPELLRGVGARITELPDAVAVLAASTPDGMPVLVVRGANAELDAGAFLRQLAAACGGRGGGRPERAEGRLPAGTDITALAERLFAELSSG